MKYNVVYFCPFNDSLLACNQVKCKPNSLFILIIKSFRFLPCISTNVSSAYKMVNKNSDILYRSFIKIINISGPNIEPCGTPHLTDLMTDCVPSNVTNCNRSVRQL